MDVLRFLTAGSVDDGKSTLIGRLLYDTRSLASDQIEALERSAQQRGTRQLDFSLLTDGLIAEREQGITIDVAYRYFSTSRRKFIIADSPGHEQYTRNMVTAASVADVTVLLVDATRVGDRPADGTVDLLPQTRRHAAVAALLDLEHPIVAVNKMDGLGWDEGRFRRIETACVALAASLGTTRPIVIPVSALEGDNVVDRGTSSPWYRGPTLLEALESIRLAHVETGEAPRLSVQFVTKDRDDGARVYLCRAEAGRLSVGDTVRVDPGGRTATVRKLWRAGRPVDATSAGEPVAVSLDREVDVSRGDWLLAADAAEPTRELAADLCWLDTEQPSPARRYWLRIGTRFLPAKLRDVQDRLNLETLRREPATALEANTIGRAQFVLGQPAAAQPFTRAHQGGRFVLIDAFTRRTVAAGLVRST